MTNSLCFFVLQAKLKAYDDLKAKYEKEHNDLKAKRTEYNTIKSSYNRLQIETKDMRDKVREHERVKPKKYWEEGIIEYYRKHPKGRGNKLVLAEEGNKSQSAITQLTRDLANFRKEKVNTEKELKGRIRDLEEEKEELCVTAENRQKRFDTLLKTRPQPAISKMSLEQSISGSSQPRVETPPPNHAPTVTSGRPVINNFFSGTNMTGSGAALGGGIGNKENMFNGFMAFAQRHQQQQAMIRVRAQQQQLAMMMGGSMSTNFFPS